MSAHRIAKLRIQSAYIEEALPRILEFVAACQKEPGCVYMNCMQKDDDPDEVLFISEYVDAKAYEEHDAAPWHQDIIAYLSDKLAAAPERGDYNKLA